MKLRTSCFNSAVFYSNVKRLWWVFGLYTIFIFLSSVLPFYITYSGRELLFNGIENTYQASILYGNSTLTYLILGVVPVGLSALLFSYLNPKGAAAFYHSIPVKRKTLYITNIVFGIVSLILPILINGGILFMMLSDPIISQIMSPSNVGVWITSQIAYAIIVFSFATVVGMLTGNSVAHLVLTYIFAALPLVAEVVIEYILELNLYGYVSGESAQFTQKYLYFGINKISEIKYFLIYLLYSLIFFIAGYFIYKLRHIENGGEIVAFSNLKPIFIYGVSVCSFVVGYLYIDQISSVNNLFLGLPLGFLGLVIANMLTKKAFTIKGVLKPAVALFITVCAFFLVFRFDLTGFERRVPEMAKIESVSVTTTSPNWKMYYGTHSGIRIVPKDTYFPVMTEEEDIENVLKFHRQKIDDREKGENSSAVYVNYKLSGGKTLLRRYLVDLSYEKPFLEPIMETEENLKYRFPVLRNTKNIASVAINDTRLAKAFGTFYTDKAEDKEVLDKIILALKEDLKKVDYDEFIYGESTMTYLSVSCDIPLVYEGTDVYVDENFFERSKTDEMHTYYIRPSYTNTIAVLTELGFYDAIPRAEHYDAVKIWEVNEKADVTTAKETRITDLKTISKLYNIATKEASLYVSDNKSERKFRLEFIPLSDNYAQFTAVWSGKSNDMPEVLKEIYK